MSADAMERAKARMPTDLDTSKMYVDSNQAKNYAEHRPRYSDEIFKVMIDYCKETMPNLNLCVDVGCGSGQSTLGFAKHFKKVIGVDISASQIACAPKDNPNVQFKVSSAEKLPFVESESVDLWCSGESFNYMPQKLTFEEADRVLKPGGTMAIFGYSVLHSNEKPIDDAIKAMFLKLLPYWPRESLATFEKFINLELPYPGWFRNDELKQVQRLTLRDYIGLVGSLWSSVAYRKAHPEEDLMGDVERSMRAALDQVYGPNKEAVFEIIWDSFIIIGRKPFK
ncbi:methyltransferase domain containing protein [Elysia marginata]|uniref:Methyltransferase domain containing protein n=1 Tax=Elysia marginata TaxID=1093978 RepID=A0AAV4H6V6_9GAST|nr:methyltransferase domain containing protein [Elysia marginata]